MKKILILFVLLSSIAVAGKAQQNPFPSIDSLIKYTNKYIRNNAIDAFTNLRLNNVLQGLARFTDSSLRTATRNVDTIKRKSGTDSIYFDIAGLHYAIKDSTGGGADSAALSPYFIRRKDSLALYATQTQLATKLNKALQSQHLFVGNGSNLAVDAGGNFTFNSVNRELCIGCVNTTDSAIITGAGPSGLFQINTQGGNIRIGADTIQLNGNITKVNNLPINYDTTTHKPAVFDANGNLSKADGWHGPGGGGGTFYDSTLMASTKRLKDSLASVRADKQNVIGYTPENQTNKSTTTSLGTSDILYPTQKAVKTYVDAGLAVKVPTSRTLTINGVSQDLSSDRTFTVAGTSTKSLPFTQGVSSSTTYTNSTLIGKTILTVSAQGTLIDTIVKPTIYFSFDNSTGTITIHNGEFAADENEIILYQDAGNGSSEIPTAHKKMLVCGDSITDPNSCATLGNPCTAWPDTTKSILQLDSLFNVARFGASIEGGASLSQNSLRSQLTPFLAAHTDSLGVDIVAIMLGTNDFGVLGALGNYDSAMSRATLNDLDTTKIFEMMRWGLWTLSKTYPHARLYWITPIEKCNSDINDATVKPIYDAIELMCKRYNTKIISGLETGIIREYETCSANGRYLFDGVHPNEKGKWLIGKYTANRILDNFITP